MAIEAYKKEQDRLEAEEAKRQNGGIEPDRRTLTMKEILGDEEKNSLLGKMLERTGDPADTQLFARITKKKPEAGDLDSLEKHRKVFEEKMKQVEAIGKELTPELALEVCQLSPDLSAILKNQIKAEDMVSMVKDNLGELAVTDPNRFAEMFDKIQKMQDFKKGDFKQLDDSVIELCKKQNINPGEYMKALAIEDAEKQDKALTDLVRKSWGEGNWGIVKNIFDVFGNVSKGDKQMLLDQKTKIDAVFADLANKKKDIGSVLAGTISENPDMREAMAKAIFGESTKKEKAGFKEAKNTPAMKEEELQKRWAKIKSEGFYGADGFKDWDDMDSTEQDSARDNFLKDVESEETGKRKGGFWNNVFNAIFAGFLKDQKAKLN